MSITLTIEDSSKSKTYSELEIGSPLTISDIQGKAENTTLSGDVYVDFVYKKQEFSVQFPYPDEDEYLELRGFYDRQFTTNSFPTISIPELGIEEMVVYMDLSSRDIISQCLDSDTITVTFRETV